MKYPEFLKKKSTIAFVAPSFGCAIQPYRAGFEKAQEKWRQEGYRMKLGPNCYEDQGIGISNKPELCGEELTAYYCDPENDCLISCGGGELMCEILDYVDFEKIAAAEPKWYMGYSDNTNMTFLLTTLCDTAAVYGPCASAFGMEPRHQSLEDAMALLRGEMLIMRGYGMWEKESLKSEENPLAPYHLTETSVIKYWLPGGGTNVESLGGACAEKTASGTAEILEDQTANEAAGVLADSEAAESAEMQTDNEAAESAGMQIDNAAAESTGMQIDNEAEESAGVQTNNEMTETAENQTEAEAPERHEAQKIQFSGRLLGGCIDCLVNLLGTRYDKVSEFVEKYKEDGIVWFLEACDLNLMGIRRAMWQMEHAGWFEHCSGFLIGRPLNGMGVEEFGIDHYQAVCETLSRHNVPILMDLDIGHLPPMMPLVCGSMARIDSDGERYFVEMRFV